MENDIKIYEDNTALKIDFVIGINPRYNHNNEIKNDEVIIKAIRKAQEIVEEKTGIFISINITRSLTIYKINWGCPENGEDTYNCSVLCNSKFEKDIKRWKVSVELIIIELMNILEQSTVSVTHSVSDFNYYRE